MSALTDYVKELRRQYDLLAKASTFDDATLSTEPPSFGGKRRNGQRRHWTRQDRNRLEQEFWSDERASEWQAAEQRGETVSIEDVLEVDDRRASTRVSRMLRRLPDVNGFHRAALVDAAKLSMGNLLAPMIVECTRAHQELRNAFEVGDLENESRDWKDIEWRWQEALEQLEEHSPDKSPAEVHGLDLIEQAEEAMPVRPQLMDNPEFTPTIPAEAVEIAATSVQTAMNPIQNGNSRPEFLWNFPTKETKQERDRLFFAARLNPVNTAKDDIAVAREILGDIPQLEVEAKRMVDRCRKHLEKNRPA